MLGSPAAWALQFGVSYWLTEAECSRAGAMWGISLDAWIIVLSAIAIPMALAAGLLSYAAVSLDRRRRHRAAGGRNRFLAAVGMAVTPIFVGIMTLNLVGELVYSYCPQG